METTSAVMSITDEQIAEIEALANDAAPFDWGPDIGMTHAETVYARSVGPDSILAIISRLRAAEKDVERMEWLESAWGGYSGRDGGFHLSVYMPSNAETLREMIDAAMKGEQR